MDNNMNFPQQNYNQNIQPQNAINDNSSSQKKKNPIVKILVIIGGVLIGIIVLAFLIISILSANSNKLICKSNEGNITIMYNDNEIVGYTASGMSYDLDEQKAYAKQIGVNAYLDEFSTWFSTNTTGTCEKEEK